MPLPSLLLAACAETGTFLKQLDLDRIDPTFATLAQSRPCRPSHLGQQCITFIRLVLTWCETRLGRRTGCFGTFGKLAFWWTDGRCGTL